MFFAGTDGQQDDLQTTLQKTDEDTASEEGCPATEPELST